MNIRNWRQAIWNTLKTIAFIMLALVILAGLIYVDSLPWWQRVLDWADRSWVGQNFGLILMGSVVAVLVVGALFSFCKRIFRVVRTRMKASKGGYMNSARPHRPLLEQTDISKREAPKRLVYKIDEYCDEQVIYALPERALFYSRVRTALDDSKTWAEFRCAMPRKEYSRLIREVFDNKGLRRPRGSDTFDSSQIPETETGVQEGAVYQAIMGRYPMHGMGDAMGGATYPGWLAQDMLHGVLPDDILKKYGEYSESFASGSCVYIRTEDLDEVNAELEKRGYELIDGSGLRME